MERELQRVRVGERKKMSAQVNNKCLKISRALSNYSLLYVNMSMLIGECNTCRYATCFCHVCCPRCLRV